MKAFTLAAVALLVALAVGYRVMHGERWMTLWASAGGSAESGVSATRPPRGGTLGVDVGGIDQSIRPQDNLYLHVNGKWLGRTAIPADKSNYGSFTEVADEAEANLRAIIEELAAGASADSPGARNAARSIGDLYRSFMDEGRIESLAQSPLAEELERIAALSTTEEVIAYMARAQRIGVGAPLTLWVNQDLRDTTQYILYFHQAGLGLPDRDYYFNEEARFAEIRDAYVGHVERMLTLAGSAAPAEAARDIVDLETRLAGYQWERAQNRDRDATYNRFDIVGADELMPGFGWPAFLEEAELTGVESFIIRQPSYFESLAGLVSETAAERWRMYFEWQLLRSMAPYLSSAFVDENFDFFGRTLRGIEENRPRWKRGVAFVERVLGDALGRIYVERHFQPEAKTRMDALVANLREAFRQSIDGLEWMSEETRREAQVKLGKFETKIGYPDAWKDYSTLEIGADSLVGNLVASNAFEHAREAGKLGGPIDRSEWFMTPQTVNAYYNPPMNEIVFPAAILQPPFFNVEADDAVNYGAIGAVIGHEFSHGFDDQGRKSDGDGNLRDWWTEQDAAEFSTRAKRLVAQYEAFNPIDDLHVDGKLTLGENIADLAGLTMAYRAYLLSLGGEEAPVIGGYTGVQRFFLGWAQVWRRKYRDDELRRRLVVDPHSPSEYRVLGVVANMPEFYGAFKVADGDGMYLPPEERVRIW